jgi:hypothetical protein
MTIKLDNWGYKMGKTVSALSCLTRHHSGESSAACGRVRLSEIKP